MRRLAVLAAALIAAFVLAPARLAADRTSTDLAGQGRLIAAFRRAFVVYWSSGDRAFDPEMRRVVDYWFRYHVAKGVLAAAVLAVLLALLPLIWRAFLRARGARAAALATGGALVTGVAVVALAAVMANVHGMAAPFGSLLPTLFGGSPAPLAAVLAQVRQRLAGGASTPPLDMITSDYVKFHAVMAVEGTIVVLVLLVVTAVLWRRFARASGGARRVLAAYGVLTPLLSLALAVVVWANATTAADPLPGLQGFFAGGW